MKKSLSTILALMLALALTLGCVSFAASEAAEAAPQPAAPLAHLMYADGSWTSQYWGAETPEGITPINAEVTGPGEISPPPERPGNTPAAWNLRRKPRVCLSLPSVFWTAK